MDNMLKDIRIITKNGALSYGGNQGWLEEKYRPSACGMIAACDLLLTLKKRNSSPIPIDVYKSFVINAAENFFYKNRRNMLGIPPRRILKYLNDNIKEYRFRFISDMTTYKKTTAELIDKSLSGGIPVIIRIGENGRRLPYKISFPTRNNDIVAGKMRWHYITVVGLKNGVLYFNSWGGRGEMLLSDLMKYRGISGGMIIAE